jgi:hypothetical protein
MKLVKRELGCPICTASLWWVPTITYLIMKINNVISSNREWLWWVAIPTMFLIWVLLNWKIKKIKYD